MRWEDVELDLARLLGEHERNEDTSLESGTPRWRFEPACCCGVAPQFRVVLPPTGERRQPTDLLLCGHHLRLSLASLAEKNAIVFDADGRLVSLSSFDPIASASTV